MFAEVCAIRYEPAPTRANLIFGRASGDDPVVFELPLVAALKVKLGILFLGRGGLLESNPFYCTVKGLDIAKSEYPLLL